MKSLTRIALSCVLLMIVGGCSQKEMLKQFTPDAEDKMARSFIELVKDSRIDDALTDLDFRTRANGGRKGIVFLATTLRGGQLKMVEEVGAYSSMSMSSGTTTRRTRLSYQLELSNGWFVMTLDFADNGGSTLITAAHLDPIPGSLEAINRFTLSGKRMRHYLVLAGAVTMPILTLAALIMCVGTKLRRKWLWILFVILGLGTVRLNWTTGAISVQLLTFQLFGASVFKVGPYAPWFMGVSAPVGAIVFLLKRKSLVLRASGSDNSPVPPQKSS